MNRRAMVTLFLGIAWVGASEGHQAAGLEGPAKIAVDTLPTVEQLMAWSGPDGEPQRAGEGILRIVDARPPESATNWIHLLSMLGRIDPRSGPVAVRAVALADEGDPLGGADVVEAGLVGVPVADAGPLLALAALLLEASDPTRAADLRLRAIDAAPEGVEVPELMLRHARWLLSIVGRREEGFQMLEDVIVRWPELPLAPEARRLLQVERTRGAGR